MKHPYKVLCMIDDEALSAEVAKQCANLHCRITNVHDHVMQKIYDEVPHLIVIDENFHHGHGRRQALQIKNDAVLEYIPIVLLAKRPEPAGLLGGEQKRIDVNVSKDRLSEDLLPAVVEVLARNHNELDLNPLTSLPGTRSSVLSIDHAIQAKKVFAVCCIDLSNLAAFNSAYGVSRGDQIIVRLGEIAREALKLHGTDEDFLGHLGGDDMIVVTSSDRAVEISEAVIRKFDSVIQEFYDPHDRELGYIVQRNKEGTLTHYPLMTVSVAIVHNDRMPLNEMAEISQIAGELKRYMKSLPGSCYIKYHRHLSETADPSQNQTIEVRFPSKMKTMMISGPNGTPDQYTTFFNTILRDKKIRTVYQPIVELKSKKIVGYEALTRALSDYPVDEATLLFSVARETGHVKELDRLCVDCALRTGQVLPSDKKLFLNLNHETLIHPKWMRDLFAEKGSIGFKNLVIEVTEQSILRSFDRVRDALLELKEQGVSVAIDDVGGGAVSLRDVATLKPDYIKFDRSLIRQIDVSTTKQQIVLSLILFAKGIHASTIAEGIETREEFETVLMCGINLGQGYYFARPGEPFPQIAASC